EALLGTATRQNGMMAAEVNPSRACVSLSAVAINGLMSTPGLGRWQPSTRAAIPCEAENGFPRTIWLRKSFMNTFRGPADHARPGTGRVFPAPAASDVRR